MRHFAMQTSNVIPQKVSLLLLLTLGLLLNPTAPQWAESEKLKTYRYREFIVSYSDQLAISTNTKTAESFVLYRSENTHRQGMDHEMNPDFFETSHEFLSVVGPIFSFKRSFYAEGGAHPSYGTRFQAVDITTGEPALLTSYFSEDQILEALLADRFIQKKLKNKVEAITTLKDLFAAFDDNCEVYLGSLSLSYFSFNHVQEEKVAVRLGLPHGCEVARGNFTELGIYLPIPQSLRSDIERSNASGLLGKH